jgi:hypothetical protein
MELSSSPPCTHLSKSNDLRFHLYPECVTDEGPTIVGPEVTPPVGTPLNSEEGSEFDPLPEEG